ncbi:MAG: carbon-nitrogen family hydrolase [Candidatus Aureabacteria bacterium]|nr:carbon-nitrogen family hydrolase [Candidatus Auribacterota bacterium]
MKLALIQMNPQWESIPANCETAQRFIEQASDENCDAVIFPEMFNTGFSMNTKATAEKKTGLTLSMLPAMAKKHSINIIAGLAFRASKKTVFNKALAYNRKGCLTADYAKMNLFSYAREDRFFTPGRKPVLFKLDKTPCSIFICYDLRFPQIFKPVAKKAEMIIVIASWPSERKDHWQALLKARAIENQCFMIGVNRTGSDGNGIHYPGMSLIFDPEGKCLASGNEKETYLTCEINPYQTGFIRRKIPFLRDNPRLINLLDQ